MGTAIAVTIRTGVKSVPFGNGVGLGDSARGARVSTRRIVAIYVKSDSGCALRRPFSSWVLVSDSVPGALTNLSRPGVFYAAGQPYRRVPSYFCQSGGRSGSVTPLTQGEAASPGQEVGAVAAE